MRVKKIKTENKKHNFAKKCCYAPINKTNGVKKMRQKKKSAAKIRLIAQISVFLFVFAISITKWVAEKGVKIPFLPEISLHAICPFGGVATVYEFITTGTFIQKIHSSAFILMLLGILVAILFGAFFCGTICPFGSFQEWTGKIGKKLFPKHYNKIVPPKLDRVLRFLRYVVLALVVYQTAVTATLVFQAVDPYYALFNFFTDEVAVTAYIALALTFLLSLIIERPWCKYFCPYGAFLGLFNHFSLFGIRRNPNTCVHCKKCDAVCPMNIEVSTKDMVRDHQCIRCYQCTSETACPVKDTVAIAIKKEDKVREHEN